MYSLLLCGCPSSILLKKVEKSKKEGYLQLLPIPTLGLWASWKHTSLKEVTCWYQWPLYSLQKNLTATRHACLSKQLNQPLNGIWRPPPRSHSFWRSCSDDCKATEHILSVWSQLFPFYVKEEKLWFSYSFQKLQMSLEKNRQIMSAQTMFLWKHGMASFYWWNSRNPTF